MAYPDKRSLTEQEIRSRFITPALIQGGWDPNRQIREEFKLTNGRIIVRGNLHSRVAPRRADYVLFFKPNIPLAIVEAKDNRHSVGEGLQQALAYAEMFDVPFAFSSNGDGFMIHDRTATASGMVERELALDAFPAPADLWETYCAHAGLTGEAKLVAEEPYYTRDTRKFARYYQAVAVNRAVEAVAKGHRRILLVMATGTGKTFTAFQIIWRLRQAKRVRRVLFLVDRNVLADQALINDFRPFGSAMTKITHRQIDKSYEVYLALYQGVTGIDEAADAYKEFSRDFFDLIIVDECHRGSAAENSAWRQVLEYFGSAVQLGMTATPRETRDVSNIEYFGDPIYTYSLRQGIDDGFLAPFKVVRVDIDKDLEGWRPEAGKLDKRGVLIEDRIYNQRDFDRALVLEQRTSLVAERISDFLKASDRYAKSIVFCEDIDHAERMRQALVNANPDLAAENTRYVVRITGDSVEGKQELDNFIDPESRYPVVATTSRMLSTGVDAQTCKVIAIDRNIDSLTEFKQIIGRGTRIREDYGKYYFTILDFRRVTEMFADPDFDGEPIQIYKAESAREIADVGAEGADEDVDDGLTLKYVVGDVSVNVVGERVQYFDRDGRLVTESLRDYTRRTVHAEYESLDAFLRKWSESDRKSAVVEELAAHGVPFDALADEVGRDYDAFDLVCHVAFGQPPLSRRERAERVRKRDYFTRYGEKARVVLDALLEKYSDTGLADIENLRVLRLRPLSDHGTPLEILEAFGGRDGYLRAVRSLEDELYAKVS